MQSRKEKENEKKDSPSETKININILSLSAHSFPFSFLFHSISPKQNRIELAQRSTQQNYSLQNQSGNFKHYTYTSKYSTFTNSTKTKNTKKWTTANTTTCTGARTHWLIIQEKRERRIYKYIYIQNNNYIHTRASE